MPTPVIWINNHSEKVNDFGSEVKYNMALAILDSNCVAITIAGTGHTTSEHHVVIPKTQTSHHISQSHLTLNKVAHSHLDCRQLCLYTKHKKIRSIQPDPSVLCILLNVTLGIDCLA